MKKALIGIVAVAMVALMINNAFACPGYTPGFWKHNIGVALGYNPGDYSAFEDTGIKLTAAMLAGYAATVGVTLEEAYAALSAKGPGMDMVRANMANAFNAAAGYGPFVD